MSEPTPLQYARFKREAETWKRSAWQSEAPAPKNWLYNMLEKSGLPQPPLLFTGVRCRVGDKVGVYWTEEGQMAEHVREDEQPFVRCFEGYETNTKKLLWVPGVPALVYTLLELTWGRYERATNAEKRRWRRVLWSLLHHLGVPVSSPRARIPLMRVQAPQEAETSPDSSDSPSFPTVPASPPVPSPPVLSPTVPSSPVPSKSKVVSVGRGVSRRLSKW